jgi:alkylation response protein AidB-like acyl-CoA dehydrogenase
VQLRHTPEVEAYRDRVWRTLEAEIPAGWRGLGALDREHADRFTEQWRRVLYDNGLLAVHWPVEYGGQGLTWAHTAVVAEEIARRGLPFGGRNDDFGIRMLGNTLVQWGTDQQKRTLLPRIVSGRDRWCQGFSEPGAGSDLAAVACRARRDADGWVIDGQKIWTSAALSATHIFVLARTSNDPRPHARLSFMLCTKEQPGITVRPIATMTGETEFSEVFFDGARTGATDIVGAEGEGWRVAMSLLGWERGAQVTAMEALGLRVLSEFLRGAAPGVESSIFKLYWSEYHHRSMDLARELLDRDGLTLTGRRGASVVYPTDDAGAGNGTRAWLDTWQNAHAATIYAGSSQVQRTVIGERLLGLPKEPRPVTETPGRVR